MSTKTKVEEWEHAVDELNKSAAEYPDMETNIIPVMKFRYNSLCGESIKSCVLYYALFPEDYEIDRERLIEYWLSEGFLGEYPDTKRAINKGHDVLGTLINASLLTKNGTREVQMHDVLQEMAIWIASYFWRLEYTYFVKGRFGLHEIPKLKDWEAVRRMSLMVVLDLFGISYNNELPEQISKLDSLQYLDLSITNIEQLHVGFQELKNLYQLNLNGKWRLHRVAGRSKFSNLRILQLLGSNVHINASLLRDLQLLEHLQVLAIKICAETDLDQISVIKGVVVSIGVLRGTWKHLGSKMEWKVLFERVEYRSGQRERPTTPAPDETKAARHPAAGFGTRSEPTPRRQLSRVGARVGATKGSEVRNPRAIRRNGAGIWSDLPERGGEPALEAERPGGATS
ncbi:hypothetical protein DY000_02041433 [Brassica cretica]|uniref:NB-ARC domain-containing protein n=1 Tax=Brassica cretica TaxID=69181 RepID=A0ABQ7BL70_BRACR|nr:hypothetical protein DY000_02041433 [Brassica cretica]